MSEKSFKEAPFPRKYTSISLFHATSTPKPELNISFGLEILCLPLTEIVTKWTQHFFPLKAL